VVVAQCGRPNFPAGIPIQTRLASPTTGNFYPGRVVGPRNRLRRSRGFRHRATPFPRSFCPVLRRMSTRRGVPKPTRLSEFSATPCLPLTRWMLGVLCFIRYFDDTIVPHFQRGYVSLPGVPRACAFKLDGVSTCKQFHGWYVVCRRDRTSFRLGHFNGVLQSVTNWNDRPTIETSPNATPVSVHQRMNRNPGLLCPPLSRSAFSHRRTRVGRLMTRESRRTCIVRPPVSKCGPSDRGQCTYPKKGICRSRWWPQRA